MRKGWESIDKRERALMTRVRRIYKALFGEPWPAGWVIEWNVIGSCHFDSKAIVLSYRELDTNEGLGTLVHELVHMNRGVQGHAPSHTKFDALVRKLTRRARRIK